MQQSLINSEITWASIGVSVAIGGIGLWIHMSNRRRPSLDSSKLSGYEQLIGSTPLIKLNHISAVVGRDIYVKMESLNPGGTGKDRAALAMIQEAERSGALPQPTIVLHDPETDLFANPLSAPLVQSSSAGPDSLSMEDSIKRAMECSLTGGLVVEGTSGSTGISLATLARARGHGCLVVLPDDQALEKQRILQSLGAIVHVVPNAAISNPKHYVNVARRLADLAKSSKFGFAAVFINQFENLANYQVHYETTGPEIYRQCPKLDAFCMSAGTGGTVAGAGQYLKQQKPSCRVVLVDPPGSALYHKVKHGVVYASEQREQTLRRHRYDTLAEGIGLDRLTANLSKGVEIIDDAVRVSDQEAVDMAHYLLRMEGLWVGSSSSMNVVGAIRTALSLPKGSRVVTLICDAGTRHATRFWNPDFLKEWGVAWPTNDTLPACLIEKGD